jgi:putative aminopeptidase FrvX
MKTSSHHLLVDLLALPTAPFNEQYIAGYIRRWAAGRPDMKLDNDKFGNLRLRLRRGPAASSPLVFSGHMDHPGFEAQDMIGRRRLQATWRGGVQPEYFPRAKVRFFSDGAWVRGTIKTVKVGRDLRGRPRVQSVSVAVPRPVARGAIGMWDFPDPTIKGTRLYARGCDDVGGVAAIMAALDRLSAGRSPVDVYATFTRAEEVGFAGAIAGSHNGLIPRRARIVAVETSSEIPGVKMGDGPILRVGDRDAVFTPSLTAFCRMVADDLAGRDKTFKYQRKLMDAGTCESAAFCEFGYQATGLCVALGNYHNMDRARRRLGPEYIDLGDWNALVKWFAALATSRREYQANVNPAFRKALDKLDRAYTPLLRKTAARTQRTNDQCPGINDPGMSKAE